MVCNRATNDSRTPWTNVLARYTPDPALYIYIFSISEYQEGPLKIPAHHTPQALMSSFITTWSSSRRSSPRECRGRPSHIWPRRRGAIKDPRPRPHETSPVARSWIRRIVAGTGERRGCGSTNITRRSTQSTHITCRSTQSTRPTH